MKKLAIFASNWIKVVGIWATDLVNRIWDPYEEFTRQTEQKYPESLADKAEKFERDLVHFWVDDITQYNLPVNSGDQALWHGIYTAMAAIRYSLQGESALRDLLDCREGLAAHHRYDGAPRLIRGYRADHTYEDNASNDQLSGHLLGLYFMWKYGDSACRETATWLVNELAQWLLSNNEAMLGADGKPTTYGELIQGWKTDPLRLTLCLAVYRVAHRLTNDPRYLYRYEDLASLYGPMIPYAKVRLLWWDKTYDTHRAAIHYSILCDLETDHDLHRKYLRGLMRVWKMDRKTANPWIYYLVRRQMLIDPGEITNVIKHLEEFTLEDKQYNVERINSSSVETFNWGGHLRTRQPLPRWKTGSQDFFWQRHLYSADDWIGNKVGNVRHNGLDFLIAYYGLKSLRLI